MGFFWVFFYGTLRVAEEMLGRQKEMLQKQRDYSFTVKESVLKVWTLLPVPELLAMAQ